MNKDHLPVAQLRDLLLSLYGFVVSATGFVLNHLFNQELWLTFATAAGGALSVAKAVQIIWQVRRSKKEAELQQAVVTFAKRADRILSESEKSPQDIKTAGKRFKRQA